MWKNKAGRIRKPINKISVALHRPIIFLNPRQNHYFLPPAVQPNVCLMVLGTNNCGQQLSPEFQFAGTGDDLF